MRADGHGYDLQRKKNCSKNAGRKSNFLVCLIDEELKNVTTYKSLADFNNYLYEKVLSTE